MRLRNLKFKEHPKTMFPIQRDRLTRELEKIYGPARVEIFLWPTKGAPGRRFYYE